MFSRVLFYKPCRERSPISKEKFDYMVHSAMYHKNHVSMKKQRRICNVIKLGIFSSTIKNNILFGKDYDEKLFQRVIRASALEAVCRTTTAK